MTYRLPPMYSLRAFEAAARLSGFKNAAEELNQTPAAVAHQIKKLEADLEIDLFSRTPKGVSLNPAGLAYFKIVNRLINELGRETLEFKSGFKSQPIRVAAAHIVSNRLLRPLILEFLGGNLDMNAEIIAATTPPNIEDGEVDVIIWYGAPPSQKYLSLLILEETLCPVCSPSYLAEFKHELQLTDLKNCRSLYDLHWDTDWSEWCEACGIKEPRSSLGFSLYGSMLRAAEEGAGIGIGHMGLIQPEIQNGNLVKPFDIEIPNSNRYYMVTTQKNIENPLVNEFWNWVSSRFSQNNPSE